MGFQRRSGRSEVVLFDSNTVERRLEFGVTVLHCHDARGRPGGLTQLDWLSAK
jgi:hypothetical protein